MLKAIKNIFILYPSIYRQLFNCALSKATTFRTSFVLIIIMDLIFYASTILSVDVIFQHVPEIGPWNRSEFQFFLSFMLILDNLHMTFLSENFWSFSLDLKSGALDYTILRPVSPIFLTFFKSIRICTLFNTPLVFGLLFYFGHKAGVQPHSYIWLPFLIIMGFLTLALIEIGISLFMFWSVEGNGINFLRMQFQNISRWPDFIFDGLARKILFFAIPVLMVGTPPARFLLNKSDYIPMVFQAVAVPLLLFGVKFLWDKGLLRYESASS